MRALPRPLGALTLLAAACLAGCVAEEEPISLPATRGYLLISIDTLRADHLGCYGYSLDTSPFIDSLAERGVVFENAFVQLPGTLPSHMSIFTGLYPAEHGVMPPTGVLSPDIETLPEAFRRHGFATAGHTEGGYMHGGYGFARGFDDFSHEAWKIETDIERTMARGLDFLRGLGAEEPFFLFLHTYAVHDPYFPEDEYLERFWQKPVPEVMEATGPNLVSVNRGETTISDEDLQFYRASYDASIRYMDDVLRGFFDELAQLGILDHTTVVLTSDHGEEFLEHGKLVHEQIYPEILRVPLLVLHPAIEARRVSTVVQSIDIAPTLYDVAAVEPSTTPSGRSLVPLLAGGALTGDSEAFATSFGDSHRALVRRRGEGLHQLVLSSSPESQNGPVWVSRERSFDTFESALELEVRGFHTADRLSVEVNGEAAAAVDLQPGAWVPVKLALKGAGKKRVRLASGGCTVPKEVGLGEDPRCLSFQIRGVPLLYLELFDLADDPLAARDVSDAEGDLLRSLVSRLDDYRREPVASSEVRDLDPDLEERLKALGYLR